MADLDAIHVLSWLRMTRVSILLPVFNELQYTKQAIVDLSASLSYAKERLNGVHFSIVIFDDGSTDGTPRWIEDNHPEIYLLRGDGNQWWSGSINAAARFSITTLNADFLLLWNNDIVIEKDYLYNLCLVLGSSGDNIVIGSKILFFDVPGKIWSMGARFNPVNGEKCAIGYMQDDNERFSKPIGVDCLPGMGTCIPASLLKRIGYWDAKNFPQYHSDWEFTYRAKMQGMKVVVYPELKIWNHTEHTGLSHNFKFSQLWASLKSPRSIYNFRRDYLFYKKCHISQRAYFGLLSKYVKYIGRFIKWKARL